MSEELFAVPQGGKPALLQARERLVAAEVMLDKALEDGVATFACRNELRDAQAEVRRLELEALHEARRSTLDPQHSSLTKEGV